MRIIKFRVWQPIAKKFYYWGFIDNAFIGIPLGAGLTIKDCKKNSQQFTDLFDKNGIEIYGGDILKTYSKYFKKDLVVKVIEAWGAFRAIGIELKDWEESIVKYPDDDVLLSGFAADLDWEVIGNICENSELLKKHGGKG